MQRKLLRAEFRAMWKSQRLVLTALLFVLLAGLSLAAGRWASEILAGMLGSEFPELANLLPEPSTVAVGEQWAGNINQLGMVLSLVLIVHDVNRAMYAPTGHLLLTRPVQRSTIVLSTLLTRLTVIAVGALVGLAVIIAGSYVLFGSVHVMNLLIGTGLWLAAVGFYSCFGLLAAVIRPVIGAILASVGMLIAGSVAGEVPVGRDTAFGLVSSATTALTDQPVEVAWQLFSLTAGLIVAWIALRIYASRDI